MQGKRILAKRNMEVVFKYKVGTAKSMLAAIYNLHARMAYGTKNY